jgi:hypothetical protein
MRIKFPSRIGLTKISVKETEEATAETNPSSICSKIALALSPNSGCCSKTYMNRFVSSAILLA